MNGEIDVINRAKSLWDMELDQKGKIVQSSWFGRICRFLQEGFYDLFIRKAYEPRAAHKLENRVITVLMANRQAGGASRFNLNGLLGRVQSLATPQAPEVDEKAEAVSQWGEEQYKRALVDAVTGWKGEASLEPAPSGTTGSAFFLWRGSAAEDEDPLAVLRTQQWQSPCSRVEACAKRFFGQRYYLSKEITEPEIEECAYFLAQQLDKPYLVPETWKVDGRYGLQGSLQKFVPQNTIGDEDLTIPWQEFFVLNYLLGNLDYKEDHAIISGGHVVAIDNGNSFPVREHSRVEHRFSPPANQYAWESHPKATTSWNPSVVEWVKGLDLETIKKALVKHESRLEEAMPCFERRFVVLQALVKLESSPADLARIRTKEDIDVVLSPLEEVTI